MTKKEKDMSTATVGTTDQQIGFGTGGTQYLTFDLADEHYGVDILKVQEIKGYTAVTRIPNTPEYLKGVLNLRGTIVPIIDLRLKFGMGATEPTAFTVIVVANVKDRVMGILADAVSDVLEIAENDIQPPPELGPKVDVSFVSGIGSCNDHLVTLLDIDRVMSDDEVVKVSTVSEEEPS
jgi:purine-binding chemotaxis protein CheW